MDMIQPHRFYTPFVRLIILISAVLMAFTAVRVDYTKLDIKFFLIACITVFLASRVVVKFFRFNAHVSATDIFIFLTIMLFGGDVAILLGGVESYYSSIQITRRRQTRLFNGAAMLSSTFITVHLTQGLFGNFESLTNIGYSSKFIMVISFMGFIQYLTNSSIVSIAAAFWSDQPILQTWKQHFAWTSITYLAGASAAGLIFRLTNVVGFFGFIAIIPIIATVYFTYLNYVNKVESSTEKAESEKRFHEAFDHAPIGMALASPDGHWLQVNHSLCNILGYENEELLKMNYQAITHAEDLAPMMTKINEILEGKASRKQIENRYIHKQGEIIWTLVGISLLSDPSRKTSNLIFQIQDINDRKRAEQQLFHEAYHDSLTQLPNRPWFIDQLEKSLWRIEQGEEKLFAVLFLDLDRFKVINDSIGNMFGDQLLIGVAERLKRCLREGDKVARLGGDEFTILLNNIHNLEEAIEIADRIQKEIELPFKLGSYETFTTVSIGIAFSDLNYERPEELLRDADTAMYQAKSLGKARHVIFDKGMHARAMNLLQLETDLRRAIERKEFSIQYQPILSIQDGKLKGFEALVRWQHPERGLVAPNQFIAIAEETGLIVPIGRWVLEEAFKQLTYWEDHYVSAPPLFMSINLSSKQFADLNLLNDILRALKVSGVSPHNIKLEITESVVMENMESASQMLDRLRSLGIELSIDDFGTGYSSLSYLHRLPINNLKIDRSFITRIHENPENKEIVRTILLLAQNLGLEVIAEGIETKEQLEILQELNCSHGQGYYFSKPLDAELAGNLIQKSDHLKENIWIEQLVTKDGFLPLASKYKF